MHARLFIPLAAGCACIASTAHAEGFFNIEPAPGNFYASVFGGGAFPDDPSFTGVSNPDAGVPGPTGVAGVPLTVDLDKSSSFTYGGAVGATLPFTFWGVFQTRLEVEVSYFESDVDSGSFNGGNQIFGGDQDALFVYFNNYTNLVLSENQRFTPYAGGGIGVAFVDSNVTYFPAAAGAPVFGVFGEDTALAGHFAVGASYALTENFDLYSEGRYFRIQDVALERRFIGGGADIFNGDVEDNIDGFTVTGGLRYKF